MLPHGVDNNKTFLEGDMEIQFDGTLHPIRTSFQETWGRGYNPSEQIGCPSPPNQMKTSWRTWKNE